MCEYCGCQALETIDELTQEHERVRTLISRVREAHRGGNIARMAETAREIAAVLRPHHEVEEHGLFPALAHDLPGQMAELEAEHRRVEAVLAEADGPFLADPTWPRRLIAALDLLRDHMLEEQDGVFPAALATLGVEDWGTAEKVRAKVRAEAGGLPSRPAA